MTRCLRSALLLLLACVCLLCSCRSRAEFSAGQKLSGEEAQEALASMGETAAEDNAEEKLYYFVMGSGTVYHSLQTCSHLKNSKNVQCGTLSQVIAAGKERLCATCARNEKEAQASDETDAARVCYYTVGGSVWHYDSACASLAHSENVRSGTVEQAMQEGKTRACARCGDQQ